MASQPGRASAPERCVGERTLDPVGRLCVERRIPRNVGLVEGDSVLPIDLECVFSLESLIQLTKNHNSAVLVERLGEHDELCVRGPEGAFVHEVIVPFVRTAPPRIASPSSTSMPADAAKGIRRTLPPGSDWLYVKLYTGEATADRLLCETVAGLAADLLASGTVDGWFFIRLGQPEYHLRVRFHGKPGALLREALPRIMASATKELDAGRLWRIEVDHRPGGRALRRAARDARLRADLSG